MPLQPVDLLRSSNDREASSPFSDAKTALRDGADAAHGAARSGMPPCGDDEMVLAAGVASPPERAAITDAQWLVLFLAELGSIAPAISDSKSFALGSRLVELRAVDQPERAAASVAVGLGLLSVH